VPPAHLLAERLDSVLGVLYLIFTEGYAATSGETLIRHELCNDAIRLGRVLEALIRQTQTDVPAAQQAEVLGLLALMLLHHSRHQARLGADGGLVTLDAQDRTRWDVRNIHEGLSLLDTALRFRQPGPFQIQAAISALHARASSPEPTDWVQIAGLYGELRRFTNTPIVRLNQAVAVSFATNPATGLRLLALLDRELTHLGPYRLAQADMYRRNGQPDEAREANRQALDLTQNAVERAFILRRIADLGP
jgi:RNA polymerase sigma-70 factor (ECF subfamily)